MMKIALSENKILTSSSGKALEIPFENIVPSPTLWFDALEVEKDVNNYVHQWTDLSPNGNHFIQNTQAAKPLWEQSGFSNKPSLQFNGAQYLYGEGHVFNMRTLNRLVFIIGNRFTTTFTSRFISKTIAANQTSRYAISSDPNLFCLYHDNVYRPLSTSNNLLSHQLIVHEVNRDLAIQRFYINGQFQGWNAINALWDFITSYIPILGGAANNTGGLPPASYHNGNISEILVYDTINPLSENQKASITSYFLNKYAL